MKHEGIGRLTRTAKAESSTYHRKRAKPKSANILESQPALEYPTNVTTRDSTIKLDELTYHFQVDRDRVDLIFRKLNLLWQIAGGNFVRPKFIK